MSRQISSGSNRKPGSNRIAIVGCDNVAAANAYSLLTSGSVDELVLIGKENNRLLGEVSDLQRAVPLDREARVWAGNYPDAADAAIAVIAAGAGRRGAGESGLDRLSRNAALVREITRKLRAAKFNGIILMTTNPVDVLAQVAQEESGFPVRKVIGSGKVFDASQLIGEENVDAETATWCAARLGASPLVDFCQPNCPDFGKMLERAHNTPVPIVRRKTQAPAPGSSAAAAVASIAASCVTRICEAILRDERTVLPVSTMSHGQFGVSDVYLNLPCVIGREGVEQIVDPPLPIGDTQREDLAISADFVRRTLNELKNSASSRRPN